MTTNIVLHTTYQPINLKPNYLQVLQAKPSTDLVVVNPPAVTVIEVKTPVQRRLPNADYRTREYLTDSEIDRLMTTARAENDYGHRDATMLMVAYRHGLRVSELIDLRWDQIDFTTATIAIRRLKRGTPSTQPIMGDELRALQRLRRNPLERTSSKSTVDRIERSPFIFITKRRGPFTTSAVAKMINRLADRADLEIKAHPHMLRHACGFTLTNKGLDTRGIQGYLGHRNIEHTVRYTELAEGRFKDFWR